jgi:serine/threonine-protein kinase
MGELVAGKYQLAEIVGEGGMAVVYRATVVGSERSVAIKHIKPEFRALQKYVDMFVEEARVGSELQHPNIVDFYEFVSEQGSYYLVTEWVEGLDLGALIKMYRDAGANVAWPLGVAIAIGTLRGLGAAHDRRAADGTPSPVIHRDVSPQNILLGVNGEVKITDFGLARARDRVASLTAPGTVKGKLNYLAPEVAHGKPATTQSDLFGAGSILWETLATERLFDGKNDIEIFRKIRACKVPPIAERRPDLPPPLVAALDVALTLDPAKRYATADDFVAALSHVMKLAPNVDPDASLGDAVRWARAQPRG